MTGIAVVLRATKTVEPQNEKDISEVVGGVLEHGEVVQSFVAKLSKLRLERDWVIIL